MSGLTQEVLAERSGSDSNFEKPRQARGANVVSCEHFPYIRRAMQRLKQFRADEWCFDPYAKQCERCDIIIGRYAVMKDDRGLRQVVFWPHAEWDGVDGSRRCRVHTRLAERWLRLF